MSLVLAALVAGCLTSAVAASGIASTPITKAEAVAFAQAVNLRAGDLPGATELPAGHESTGASQDEEPRCARPRRMLRRPLYAEASLLSDPDAIFVASAVGVMRTEALAEAELSALASPRGRVCLARALGEVVSVEGEKRLTSVPIKVTFVPVAKTLGPGAIGLHVLAKLPHTPKTAVLHADEVLFRVGPAEIFFLTLGVRRFPTATEARLLSLLYSRAEEYKP